MKGNACTFISVLFIISCKKDETQNNNFPLDELSDTQIQAIEAAGVDSTSTYKVALFPDGSNMSKWGKKMILAMFIFLAEEQIRHLTTNFCL